MKGYWQKGNLLGLKSIDFCKSLVAKVSYVPNEIWSERERKKKAHHPRETACKNKKTTWDSSWLVGNPASGPQSNSGTVKTCSSLVTSSLYRLDIYCCYSLNPCYVVVSVDNVNSLDITLVLMSSRHFFH